MLGADEPSGRVGNVPPPDDKAAAGLAPHVLIHIALDGTTTIVCHRSEMGQGSLTGLAEARFPVAARARYADDLQEREQLKRVKLGENAAAVGVALLSSEQQQQQ